MSRPDHVYSHNSSEAHQHDVGDILEAAPSLPYLPLSSQTREIRVLDLARGGWQEALSGNLRRVSLDARPKYEALSYTWGASIEGRSITINKHSSVAITDNLHRALQRLRGRLTKRTIWCDAICIDQSNIQEREHQVSIMGHIYKQAMTVLIWLGEYPNTSSHDQWLMRRPHWKRRGNSEVINSRGQRFGRAIDKAICDTMPRWSDRAWIVQEFVLSSETILCFGPVSIPYDPVHVIDFLILHQEPLPHLRAFHERTSDMVKLKYGIGNVQQSIAEAALYTSTAACSDDRDRVLSLLSLIDGNEAEMIGSSYRRSCAETFARATYASIVAQNKLLAFELVRFCGTLVTDLPTWAVDFTQPQIPNAGRVHMHTKSTTDIVSPAERTKASESLHISSDARYLTIAGVSIGSVVRILGPLSFSSTQLESHPPDLARRVASFLNELLLNHSKALSTETLRMIETDRIEPTLLCTFGEGETPVHFVLGAASAVWHDAIGHQFRHRQPLTTTFWQIEARKRRKQSLGDDLSFFIEYALHVSGGYAAFATSDGFFGVAPSSIGVGDSIVLVGNSRFPLVVRSNQGFYNFRGLAYAHGVMEGRLFTTWTSKDMPMSTFVLA